MIIIEGTDKAGKTTLLSNLIRYFPEETKKNLTIEHFGLLPQDWDYCDDYLQFIRSNIILDRFVDSERAYGPVYRGTANPRLTRSNLLKVYKKCTTVGTLVLYCNPNVEAVVARIDAEGDLMIKKREQLEALRREFDIIFNDPSYPLDIEMIDTTQPIKPEVYRKIVNKSLILEKCASNLTKQNFRGYASPSSKYIIYTETYNQEFLDYIVEDCTHLPVSHFAYIAARNNENNPVNIQNLISNLPTAKKVIVYGPEAINDYAQAGNSSAAENCQTISELITCLSRIK